MKTLQALYKERCCAGLLQKDLAQEALVPFLDDLRQALIKRHDRLKTLSWPESWFGSWGRLPPAPLKGLYIWGDVGRGKTFLMDFFESSLEIIPRKRLHFHTFMQEVHRRLHTLQKDVPKEDLFKILAKEMRGQADILCLDEFFLSHIGDAMILSRLFEALFQEGVVLVTTSNTPPERLYWKGLQRELVLPFINLLSQHVRVLFLEGAKDFRQSTQPSGRTHLNPLGSETDRALQDLWDRLTEKATPQVFALQVKGRTLHLKRTAGSVCWATFDELCGHPLGVPDYLELLKSFSILILSDIPDLVQDQFNEARRFITLVDLLYEHRFLTFFSAAVPLSHLYLQGEGAKDFKRTRSRLEEMQTWKI